MADPLPLHERSFDLVLLSNWEDKIVFEPEDDPDRKPRQRPSTDLTTPANKAIESGEWTQSIIWDTRTPFRDFTKVDIPGDDAAAEDRRTSTFIIVILHICVLNLSWYSARNTTAETSKS